VQVSRTLAAQASPRALKPASEKRQGTKSRDVGLCRRSGLYGDSASRLSFKPSR